MALSTASKATHHQSQPRLLEAVSAFGGGSFGGESAVTSSTSYSAPPFSAQPGGGATGTATGSLCFFFFLRQRWAPCLLWRLVGSPLCGLPLGLGVASVLAAAAPGGP